MDEKVIKIVNEARWADGQKVWNRFEDITFDPMQCQHEFMSRLIRENAKTAFGRDHGFEYIHNLDEYRQHVHLTTYNDYPDYIERIANGERNVLTAYLTEHLSPKKGFQQLPQSRWGVQAYYDYCFSASFYIAGNHGLLTDGMTLNLVDNRFEQLPSGVYKGNLLGRLLTKRDFDYNQVYVIPIDITSSPNRADILYLQALLALKQRYISIAICDNYDDMLELFRYIEKHWPRLTEDIEHGNSDIQPDSERAREIREIMESHHIGTQMVEQLWPGLQCIIVYDVDRLSASFELLRTYCGSKVHYLFTGISSPEGTFSTALNLDDPQTVLIPDSVFYEFKPKEASNYDQLLTLDQLEIGHSYELIVSTLSGLYRYKTQKCFLVVGRYHDTPTVIVDKV
jgi:hypothetical protein